MPTKPEILLAVDYYDLIWITDELFGPEHMRRLAARCAETGVTGWLWRVSVCGLLLYHSETPDNFRTAMERSDIGAETGAHREINEKTAATMKVFDPLAIARDAAREYGLTFYPWLTLYDEYGLTGGLSSSLCREHPEYCWQDQEGRERLLGICSYAYPEVRDFKQTQIRELAAYDADGLYLCLRSHARAPRYREALRDFFRQNPNAKPGDFSQARPDLDLEKETRAAWRRFGFDPPAVSEFTRQTGQAATPENDAWWRWRSHYLTDFLRETRTSLNATKQTLSIGPIPAPGTASLFPSECFDWQRWLDEDLVDTLYARHPLPAEYAPRARGWISIFKDMEFFASQATRVEQELAAGDIGGAQLFEAMHLFQNPQGWDIVRRLGNAQARFS